MSGNNKSARVIKIDGRYFRDFSPTNRTQISPYLAGAKLYFPDIDDLLQKDLSALRKKGWSCSVWMVEVTGRGE